MEKKKKIPTSFLTALIVSIALVLLDIGLGIAFIITSMNRTANIIKSKVMENAQTAANLLDPTEVGYLTIEDKEQQTERYTKAFNTLSAFKTSSESGNAELAYVYLLVQQGDKIVFSVDPSDDPGEFLVEEPIYTDAMRAAFLGNAGVDDKPYTDRWGKLYSGYAPVINGDKVVAVVGIDIWADYLDRDVAASSAQIISISAVTIALGVGLSLLITFGMRRKLKELSNEIEFLDEDVNNLVTEVEVPLSDAKEEGEVEEVEDTNDPVEHIHNTLTKLRNEINRYIAYAREQASTDRLTHLRNRNAYFKVVKTVNDEIANNELKDLVVAIYDANGLKGVNDSNGHEYGDRLLKIAAKIIQKVYGVENSFRIGGDEFVIILRGDIDDFNAKHALVTKMVGQFNNANIEWPFDLSLSVGVASYEVGKDKELLDIFRKADKNMYENKKEYYKEHDRRSE